MTDYKEERKRYLLDYAYFEVRKARIAIEELVNDGYDLEDIKYILERAEELIDELRRH